MPIDREHAFADGLAYPRPTRWLPPWKKRTPAGRAALAWEQFSMHARVVPGCRLGPNAWCVNSLGNPDFISLGEEIVCRGLLRIERFGAGRIVFHPHAYIGDDCTLFAGAKVLGTVRLGDGVRLGANAVLLTDAEPHSTYAGIPAVKVSEAKA